VPVHPPGTWIGPDDRTDGEGIVSAGRFRLDGTGRFDRHHHDDDELWFIAAGKALIETDGATVYVQTGDIVRHRAGVPHDIIEVYEALSGFFTEVGHPRGGRAGHLHADETDAAGHPVPLRPLPADFPHRD
jgi:mannose-6-phosphate isomerase-like protein (cupin superfamily)